MKRSVILVLIAFIVINLNYLNLVYAADSLKAEKLVENQDIRVGDDVNIVLKFTNPFDHVLPVKIADRNVFGNNGMDIQCLEYTLPADRESVISYEPIKPFSSGQYTLDAAQITYINPKTGKEEAVNSNPLEIEVKESGTHQRQAQGITTIYRCNGMNMQSTSYSSSGSSFNIQIGSSNIQSGQGFQQQSSPQDRVQNNQMNQNINSLKQQMEQQALQQKQMEQEFQQILADSKKFQENHQKLLEQGYNLTDAFFNPETNNTGYFELSYKKQHGETATLKGGMENGTIKSIMSLSSEDKQKILDALQKNEEFQNHDSYLTNRGFNQTQPVFNQLSQNHTKISIHYKRGAVENRITADYINGTIQNIKLENSEKENGYNFWWLFLLIAVLCLAGWLVYRKKTRKTKKQVKKQELEMKEKSFDYKKEAMRMIETAKKLFSEKKEKDSYEKISQSIRLYFSYKLDIKKEIINSELLDYLKKNKKETHLKVKECLDLCSLVEFARYKPNKKDFDKITKIAEKFIGE